MKKSLLALLALSTLAISACDTQEVKALKDKLTEAEQTIVQLNQSLAKSSQETVTFPALQVKIEPLFEKEEKLKLAKNEFDREESFITYVVSAPKTGLDWLDNLVIRQILNGYEINTNAQNLDPNRITGTEKEELLKRVEAGYAEDLVIAKSGEAIGIENITQSHYIGQRNNLVMFSIYNYAYSGGAHGMFSTNYLTIDVNKKRVLELSDVLAQGQQKILDEKLSKLNADRLSGTSQEGNAEVSASGNFYFGVEGMTFVYPPYELGAFAEGEVTLTLPWEEANTLLKPEYQQ